MWFDDFNCLCNVFSFYKLAVKCNKWNGLRKQIQVRKPCFLLTHLYRLGVRSQKLRPLAGQFEALDDVPSFRTQSLPSCTLCKEKCRYGCVLQWGIPPKNGFCIKSNIFLQFLDSSISRNSYMDLSEKMGVAADIAIPKERRLKVARCHRLNLWLVLCNASPISPPESSSMRWIPLVLAQRTHAFQPADTLFC